MMEEEAGWMKEILFHVGVIKSTTGKKTRNEINVYLDVFMCAN